MKKLFLMIAAVAATFSAFAEDFTVAKYQQLLKNNSKEINKYCYEANVSKETNFRQAICAFKYYICNINKKPTKQQIEEFVSKYKLNNNDNNKILAIVYARAGFTQQALNLFGNNGSNYLFYLIRYSSKKQSWQVANKVLLISGGYNNPELATKSIEKAFRYIPETVTKEQQIKFIQKLAQIYPIPGTDFSKWKGFMGFIGYKYKALTGKDLF